MRRIHIALSRLPAIKLVLAAYCTLFHFFSQPPSIHHPATTISVNRASTCFYLRASLTSHHQLAKSHASLTAFPTFFFFFLLLTATLFVRYNNVISTNSRSQPDIGYCDYQKKREERIGVLETMFFFSFAFVSGF